MFDREMHHEYLFLRHLKVPYNLKIWMVNTKLLQIKENRD